MSRPKFKAGDKIYCKCDNTCDISGVIAKIKDDTVYFEDGMVDDLEQVTQNYVSEEVHNIMAKSPLAKALTEN